MANKELKKIMTDLAAGHITQEQADRLMKPKKDENQSVETRKNNTQTRRTKSLGGKK